MSIGAFAIGQMPIGAATQATGVPPSRGSKWRRMDVSEARLSRREGETIVRTSRSVQLPG